MKQNTFEQNLVDVMKRLTSFLLFLLIFITNAAFSQNIATKSERVWLGYITQARVSDHFSLWNDAHWVSNGFGIVRTGLSYHLNNKANIVTTLGYAHLWIYPAAGNKTFRPEHRAWGQTTASHKHSHFNFFHRLRYEARFRQMIADDHLLNEFNFNYRTRYLFQTKYNLTRRKDAKRMFYALLSDEVAYNFGEEIKSGVQFDQNRISVGAGCAINNVTLQLAYLNQLVKSASSNSYGLNHHAQFLITHNFDFRKSKK